MVMRAQDVGSQLTRVEQADGARADEWRQAEIVARSQVCSLKALFEANRNKLIEARKETEVIRRTAKDALSLQAEVQRLTKLLAATHVGTAKALHDGVVAYASRGPARGERAAAQSVAQGAAAIAAPPGHAQDAVQGQRAVAQVVAGIAEAHGGAGDGVGRGWREPGGTVEVAVRPQE